MKRKLLHVSAWLAVTLLLAGCATQIDTLRVYVPEEGGINFEKITDESLENLANPNVTRVGSRLQWWVNPLFCISRDGKTLAYNVFKNEKRNIFIKSLDVRGVSTQRTTRASVNDVCMSPDGKSIYFLSQRGTQKGEYNIWKMNFNL